MIAEKTAPCRPPESATHLLTFFALAFAGSWSCGLLARAWRVEFPLVSTTLSLTGGFGPSLAAVVLVAFGGGRVGLRRRMTGCLQWRAGWAWLFNRSRGSIVPVLALHTAVNAWFLIIPVMVLPDGSNLRPFQIVVGMLVMTAIALLLSSGRLAGKGVEPA